MRRGFEAAAASSSTVTTTTDGGPIPLVEGGGGGSDNSNQAWQKMMQHVQTMDCNEAYKQMCLAQDEIKRLQSLVQNGENDAVLENEPGRQYPSLESRPVVQVDGTEGPSTCEAKKDGLTAKSPANPPDAKKTIQNKQTASAKGLWLEQGGKCSIEYLPNVKCYLITLIPPNESRRIPKSKDDLQLTISPIDTTQPKNNGRSFISYYEAKLQQDTELLLSVMLPHTITNSSSIPNYNISLDVDSISIRIQFESIPTFGTTLGSMDTMDHLLGMEESSFSSVTTSTEDLSHLCCRSCRNPMVASMSDGDAPVIKSVLPLPTGNWDDIADYLMCYEGVRFDCLQFVVF